ncbi:MAG: VIT and VWA domain-containing protein [Gammaproteobacteria bacterium]|nr:VIT and VWA domain-containing protein [Gammaproteobacteria bacterium]
MTAVATWKRHMLTLAAGAALLAGTQVQAAGLLTPADGSLPALEIRDHAVQVVIEDGYAITTVEQVFHNPHQQDLEAVYSFPVPEKGSVAEFTLWIDGKAVTGEVVEAKEARRIYAQEKAAGREAGVAEKDAYRTFQVNVSPVRAGKHARVRLVYIQPAHVDTGIGRYVYPLEEGGVDEQKLAFWTANEKVSGRFSFDLRLKSAYPVEAIRVPNQPQAVVQQHDEGEWNLSLGGANTGKAGAETPLAGAQATATPVFTLDRDVVVYWRHKAGLPGSVDLVAYKRDPGTRGTFMLVVTPGDDLKPITKGRDWVLILDISGSMQGKYATLADGVSKALGRMRPADRFRIVVFNDSARELTGGFIPATPEQVRHWSAQVANVQPGGGTNLYAGVREGLRALAADRTSGLLLVTDGVANVGETKQRKFLELLKRKDVRLFTFVLGNSANRPLLEAMSKASDGFAMNVSNSDDIVGQVLTATSKVTHEALHGVKLKIRGVKVADLTPAEIGSLYRGQQMVVFGHYWGDGPADVRLTGKVSGQPVEYRTGFDFPASALDNPEVERLWAYASIEDMMAEVRDFGEKADIKQAIVDLGVEYGLVTNYTSMVVVREELFDSYGIKRQNRDRLGAEHAAQSRRAGAPAQSRSVDIHQPMYSTNRPAHSAGAGALGPWTLVLCLALAWLLLGRRQLRKS